MCVSTEAERITNPVCMCVCVYVCVCVFVCAYAYFVRRLGEGHTGVVRCLSQYWSFTCRTGMSYLYLFGV